MPSPSDDPRARAAELRRQADQIEAEAERQEAERRVALAATIRSLASRLGAIAEAADAADMRRQLAAFVGEAQRIVSSGLPSLLGNSSLGVVKAQAETTKPLRTRLGRPIVSKHPFPLAVQAAGKTVEQWAEDHALSIKSVTSWYIEGAGCRRIPRAVAELIEHELGVPATKAIWRAGIRD